MSSCKKCLHYQMCIYSGGNKRCPSFTARSEWVHLLCKVGDTVWYVDGLYDNAVIRPAIVEYINIADKNNKMWLGVCVDGDIHIEKEIECFYHTCEEAEKALEGIKSE